MELDGWMEQDDQMNGMEWVDEIGYFYGWIGLDWIGLDGKGRDGMGWDGMGWDGMG